MKLLIVGGGGQIGSKLIHAAKSDELHATYLTRSPTLDEHHKLILDKSDRNQVDATIRKLTPDAIIDTAALHNVDYCENHRAEAYKINVEGSKNLAEAAAQTDSKIVYISTDYVFDGARGNYTETDAPKPINYYGQTKWEAEEAVAQSNKNHLIIRSALVYSWIHLASSESSASGKPLNFAMWAVQKLRQNAPVKIVDDQYASPTLADQLADMILQATRKDLRGLYHIAGKTRMNRYQFTQRLADQLNLNKQLITPTKSQELHQPARRPLDSSLNTDKIEDSLQIHMPSIDEQLKIFAEQAREAPTP